MTSRIMAILQKDAVVGLLFLGTYVAVGIVGYCELERSERWTATDAFYFVSATMSTVGYGDLSPTSAASRNFTCWMILFGILYAFPTLGNVFLDMTAPLTAAGRRLLGRAFPAATIDMDGDGTADYKVPRHWLVYYSKNLLPSIALNVSIQLISSAIFCALESEWNYSLAAYHCLVTATTVGYGDVFISTQGGRLWASFHMLASVALLGELISTISNLRDERAVALARISQLQKRLEHGLYERLMARAREMRPAKVRDLQSPSP